MTQAGGRPEPAASRTAVALACALLVGMACAMTLGSLALTADGAYFLVRVLGDGEPFGFEGRIVGAWIRQGLVVAAARAGVTDTHALTLLLGTGQLLAPALVWSLAIVLSRGNALVCGAVTMAAGLCAGSIWFFSALENIVAVPLTVLVSVMLWRPAPWRGRDVGIAVTASLALVAVYETALLTSTVLAVWAAWRARRAAAPQERYACVTVSALSVAAVAVAALSTQARSNPTNSQSLAYFVVSLEPWPFYLGIAAIALVVAGLGPWLDGGRRWFALGPGCVALAVSVVALEPGPVTAFQARGGTAVLTLVLQAFLMWSWHGHGRGYRREGETSHRLLLILPVSFVAALVAANVQPVRDWTRSLEAFRDGVERQQGIVTDVDVVPPDRQEVLWSWTSSSLSLIVRPRADAAILVNRDPSWVPFAPSEARSQLDDDYTWRS